MINWKHAGMVSIATALIATGLAGCSSNNSSSSTGSGGNSAPANAPTYELITNGQSPFWEAARLGMVAAGKALHVNTDMDEPAPSTNDVQVTMFKDAVAKQVAGIGMSSVNPAAITGTINSAVAQKIPVISFDSDATQSNRLAYIGTNNFKAGEILGNYVKTLFPNGGKLVGFVGTMSQQNAIDRYNGLLSALKGTNITFLAQPYLDQQDKNVAQTNVQNAITRYQSQGLNGLVGLYSYDGPAIIDALHQLNLRSKFKVICFDGDPQTLKGLADGDVDCTVVQKPYYFGYLSVMLLNYLHQDGNNIDAAFKSIAPEVAKHKSMKMFPSKHIIDTGVTLVTPANAAAFLAALKAKNITST